MNAILLAFVAFVDCRHRHHEKYIDQLTSNEVLNLERVQNKFYNQLVKKHNFSELSSS